MDEGFQKSGSRLSLPLASSSNADPKRVSLPVTNVTPVKRCESPQSKRVVLKELCANTFKKLSINNKVTPSPFKSGSATPTSKQPPASPEKDHETNVQFAREFVEELVEKLPGNSVPVPEKEDTARYSVAFSDISAFSETSLPDLLQPEEQYKKQADTDTDTTDYESAVESDALSLNTSLGLDRSDTVSSPDVLDPSASPSTASAPRGDSEAFEDAEASLGRSTPLCESTLNSLCLGVGRLSLDSPQRPSLGDSFLVTLNPDCQAQSTDTSFNTSESELQGIVLGESFCESSLDSKLLSTTFEVAPSGEVSTEYKLEIIPTLEFDLEKPVASETEVEGNLPVEKDVSCDENKPEVEPASPVAPETADVSTIREEAVSVDSQVTGSQEAINSESQAETAEHAAETGNDLQSEVDTELDSSAVDSGLEAACKELQELQLTVSEVDSTLNSIKATTQEEVQSVSIVAESVPEVLQAPEPEASLQEEKSAVAELELSSGPIVGESSGDVLPEPEPSLQEEKSTVTELEVPAVSTVGENTTVVSPAPEPELSLPEEKSTVAELEAVPSEFIPTVVKTETEVLSTPNSDLSSSVVGLPESASTVESKTSSAEPSNNAESSLVVDPIVERPAQTEPALQASVIPEHEFANGSLTVEPQVVNQSIVGSAESESIADSSCIEDKKSTNKEDLPTAGIKEEVQPTIVSEKVDDLLIAAPNTLIVETTENSTITVSSDIANKEPANFDNLQATESIASASVALDLESKRAVSPCQFPADDPELLAFSSGPANFASGNSAAELSGRKCTISPSFLLLESNTLIPRVSPVPTDTILTPVPTHQQPFAVSNEQADLIDPVGAVWTRDVDKPSCFSAPPLQAKPVPRKPKQETFSPLVNPIQFRGSPLYPDIQGKNAAIPFANQPQLENLAPSCDPFSPIPVKIEPGHFITKSLKSTNAIEDQSLNDLREICQRQQRELDNQQFSSNLFGDTQYNSLAIASIAAEAAKVSEDIHNASIEQTEFEMDENVNPVPLDKKWLSERSGAGAKVDAKETAKSRSILGGGDGFTDSLDKQNKNIMTASIDAQTNQSEAGPEIALQDEEETFVNSEGFDFLSAKASTGPSDRLVRESLYTKFDPLATPLVTPAAAPAAAPASRNAPLPMPPKFSENDNKTSPPSGQLVQLAPTPVASTPPRSSTPCAEETTPIKNSPARALVDRLISLSPAVRNVQASPVKPPPPVVKTPTPPTMERMSEELVLLRELLSEEDMAHKVSLASLEAKLKSTEQELQAMKLRAKAAEDREQKLKAILGEKVSAQKQLAAVMCEYEKTISKLVGEKENDRIAFIKENEAIVKEKDVALGHLNSIESAFSDVHKKYERCKTVVEALKSNEDALRESLAKYEATIHKHEQKYDMLKAHAMTQLENANQELDAVRRTQATESAKLKAMLKKSELKTSSLEEMLEQKVKENCELASICDDLIAKVGT